MVELSGNPEQAEERTQPAGQADLVIGLADPKAGEDLPRTMALFREALDAFSRPLQTVIVYKGGLPTAAPSSMLNNEDSLKLLSYTPPPADPSATIAQSITADYRAIAAASEALNARAYAFLASDLDTVTPEWLYRLAQPVA